MSQSATRRRRLGRELELLVQRIRQHQSPAATVRSPDFVPDRDTGEPREVDIGVHVPREDGETFIAIECRDRRAPQSVEWIEQLISKKNSVGANVLVAVTGSRFSRPARMKALRHGVLLARMTSKLPGEIADIAKSLWLTVRYLAPTVRGVQLEVAGPFPFDEESVFRHKQVSHALTLNELVQVWLTPNLVRSLTKYIEDFSQAKFARFQLTEIDAALLVGDAEIPVTRAELTLELNFGEEELTLRGAQELSALDSAPIDGATAYDFGDQNRQLSEVILDHRTGELRWDVLARPLLNEGTVLIGCGLRSSEPVSITTMRLDL